MKRGRPDELLTLGNFEDLLRHKPVVERLAHYLPPIAYRALWSNSARFYRACGVHPQMHFYQCLKYALGITFDNNEAIVNGLLTCLSRGYALTGGFLLYVLNGDYDIISKKNAYDLDFVAPRCMSEYTDSPVDFLDSHSIDMIRLDMDGEYDDNNFIDHITQIDNVSVIYVNCSIPKYAQSFDFDFCKNAYYNNRLYVKHIDSICLRTCVVDANFYVKRAYSLDIARLYEYLYPKISGRIEKYLKRGYHIVLTNASAESAWDCITENIECFQDNLGFIRGTTCCFDSARDLSYQLPSNQFCRVWQALWKQFKK